MECCFPGKKEYACYYLRFEEKQLVTGLFYLLREMQLCTYYAEQILKVVVKSLIC